MENKIKVLKTAIPYHADECPGCVDVYHQKDQYNLIFRCNECGDQRKLTLDPEDGYSFPIGLTSPANDAEIKRFPYCTSSKYDKLSQKCFGKTYRGLGDDEQIEVRDLYEQKEE